MTAPYLAAAVQMESGEDKAANLAAASRLIEQAAAAGARLVVLPELFNCFGRFDTVAANAESVPGPTSQAMALLAARHNIVLAAGSIAERDPADGLLYNANLLFDGQGQLLAKYRKVHRFDIDLPGRVSVQESYWIAAGDDVHPAATPLGKLGVAICYDLRFPELFRRMATAAVEVILLPSAFTAATGRDHWEVLLRARAIENQAFVVAANQVGPHGGPPTPPSFGHSAIVDPWGKIVEMAGEGAGETIVLGLIDPARTAEIRRNLPALAHRRL